MKDKKIEFAPGALDNIPEDEREKVKEEIKEMFSGEHGPMMSQALTNLSPGMHQCPCGGGLVASGPVFDDDGPTQIFDCTECGRTFIGDPLN
jgi:hypothetical protein